MRTCIAWLLAAPIALGAAEGAGDAAPTSTEQDDGALHRAGHAAVAFGEETASDLAGLVTAPLRFDATDWAVAGGVVGGTALLGTLFDAKARTDVQDDRSASTNELAKWANNGGTASSFVALGAFGAWSLIGDTPDHRARRVLRDGIAATIIASGIITPAIKEVAARERPNHDPDGADDWKPFSGQASFPSGHTTQAFAVASVIAANFRRDWWVAPIAYAAAASVGWARMNDNKHYLSDVLTGAIIGTTTGWYVVLREDGRVAPPPVTVTPTFGRGDLGLSVAWRF